MVSAARTSTTNSMALDPARMLKKARRLHLFTALDDVYAAFPETRCGTCGKCCFQSPGLFYIEYLHLLEVLATYTPEQWEMLARNAVRELFFEWIEPERRCIFLHENHLCSIYEQRPLTCRLFGLTSPPDPPRAQAEMYLAAEEEADRLSWFGIDIPEATLTRGMVTCRRVRSARGRRPKLNDEELADRIATIDARLISRDVIAREYCFHSLPDRLGSVLFGEETIDILRLQLIRRAQRGESVEALLADVLRGVRLPYLWQPRKRLE